MTFANHLDSPDTYEGLSLRLIKDRAFKAAVVGALDRNNDMAKAARELGISRPTIYRLVERLGIPTPPRKGG